MSRDTLVTSLLVLGCIAPPFAITFLVVLRARLNVMRVRLEQERPARLLAPPSPGDGE